MLYVWSLISDSDDFDADRPNGVNLTRMLLNGFALVVETTEIFQTVPSKTKYRILEWILVALICFAYLERCYYLK